MSRRKKQAPAEKESGERWLLTYADLITLLLAFFLMLFATSNQDLEKFKLLAGSLRESFGGGSGPLGGGDKILQGGGSILPDTGKISDEVRAISEDLNTFTAINNLAKVGVRSVDEDIVISLSDNLLFNSADAKLRPEALPLLDRIAAELRSQPNEIRVEGHTDTIPLSTPTYASNWELSAARATEVLRYLIDQGGIAANRIHATAYADTRPVASNQTPDGRATNRRADIVIIHQSNSPPPAATGTPAASGSGGQH